MNLSDCFSGGRLPQLLYATRQTYNDEIMSRPMHRHDSLTELLFVYQGKGIYHVGTETYTIEPGDLLMYNTGEVHEVSSPSGILVGTYCFGFSDVHLHGLPENHMVPPGASYICRVGDDFDLTYETCQHIYTLMNENDPLAMTRSSLMGISLLLLAQQLSHRSSGALQSTEYTLAGRIKAYIDQHYAEPLSLNDIADALSISPYYAAHIFKESIGCPVIQYVIRRRIGEAQSLLIGTDFTVTKIGTMVGYDNSNYFSTIFSKVTGETPARYRRRFLESMQGQRIH